MSPFLPFSSVLKRPFDTVTTRSALRAFAIGVLSVILLCAVVEGAEHASASAAGLLPKHAEDPALPASTPTSSAPGEAGGSSANEAGHHVDASSSPLPLATTAQADETEPESSTEGRSEANSPDTAPEPPDPSMRIAFFQEVGRRAWLAGDRDRAEEAFARALEVNAPVAAKRELLLEMGATYAQGGAVLKAIATYEKFLQTIPNDREEPAVLLKVGLLYRDSGALTAAISRFFLVLNSTLRGASDDFETYRKLAMKARLEIAESYSRQGNDEEARKYYDRLQLLDLDDADRERVLFRGAQLQYSLGKWFDAERQLADFIGRYPNSSNTPEARYLRAKALEQLKRRDEAVGEVLALLQTPDNPDARFTRNLAHWKRRTGNELANRFYEEGDVLGALSIYQALARASSDPEWQWPAVYQIGLCFERLNLPDRAKEAYRVIIPEGAAQSEVQTGPDRPAALAAVQSMAHWRLRHLDWIEDFDKRVQDLSLESPAES